MSGKEQINIAIIDDHMLLRNQVSGLLEDMGFQVLFQAENGAIGLERIIQDKLVPDVCIVDVNMPVMNGFETAEALREKCPRTKVLAFSMNNEENSIIGMLQNGAVGYVLKGGDPVELKLAIESIHKKGCYITTEVGNAMLSYFRRGKKR
ncbi:MAG: response regulator transcription factor [Chitinophagales bacterium]|nr:response regulator transcription factor [Chitinophagales bacterium]